MCVRLGRRHIGLSNENWKHAADRGQENTATTHDEVEEAKSEIR